MAMDDAVKFSIRKTDPAPDRCELILEAAEGTPACWKKSYHGILFLAFDAQTLDLLETLPGDTRPRPGLRLVQDSYIKPAKLQSMGFVPC